VGEKLLMGDGCLAVMDKKQCRNHRSGVENGHTEQQNRDIKVT